MRGLLLAVITDGLHRATLKSLIAEFNLSISLGLLVHVGEALVIIAGEEIGSGFTAKVAVDAVAVDIELAGHILFCFFVDIGHFVYVGG